MSDEFLTLGLQEDRYLKAMQLIDQFEKEIEARLRNFDQLMADQQPDLFDPNTSPRFKTNRTSSTALVTHRINHPMEGPSAPEKKVYLNVHLYWMPPTEYNRTDVDGALRAFGYKIKGADEKIDRDVAEKTRKGDWAIETSGNPYDDNTVFYQHVSSTAEIEDTIEELVNHFSTFGDRFTIE